MSEKNQDTRTESSILNEMLFPIMNYCKDKSIPAVFIANPNGAIVSVTMGNNESTAYLFAQKLYGDIDLQTEFGKQIDEISDEDE